MPTNYFDMSGKVVLITGATRGLGYAMAMAFADQGADIVVASRKATACRQVADEIEAMGRRALAHACNTGNWDELDGLVEAAYSQFGKVDVLINNAGIAPTAPSSLETTEALFDKILAVNLKGPFRLMALVGPRMADAGVGSIINITTAGALRPTPPIVPYAASKRGLEVATQGVAFEYGPKVRVNAIMAGPFWTDISKSWRDEKNKTSQAAAQRIGKPEEIVTTALYLASDYSSFTTGTIIEVSGCDR
jgi:NAD(P)-dependent dehydrogenase (short-subunit alcohol dehydrogenase family)